MVDLSITELASDEYNAAICESSNCTLETSEKAGSLKLFNIENVIGAGGSDTITGNYSDNTLWGGAGNDKLVSKGRIKVNVLPGVHRYEGRSINYLYGEAGDDTLVGGAGYDHMDGGPGTDTVSYENATVVSAGQGGGVVVNLLTGKGSLRASGNTHGYAQKDTYTNIENVTGSPHNDTITGDRRVNDITGGGGNDDIYGGAGNDTISGGVNRDNFFFHEQFGNDTIRDFHTATNGDKIRLCMGDGTPATAVLLSHSTNSGNHLITVRFGGSVTGSITLQGVTLTAEQRAALVQNNIDQLNTTDIRCSLP